MKCPLSILLLGFSLFGSSNLWPAGKEIVELRFAESSPKSTWKKAVDQETGSAVYLENHILFSTKDIGQVRAGTLHKGKVDLTLVLKDKASKKFQEITASNIGKRIAVLIHGKVATAPVIRAEIDSGFIGIPMSEGEASKIAKELTAVIEKRKPVQK